MDRSDQRPSVSPARVGPTRYGTMHLVLELRPICEHCAVELPPSSTEAMICSYECTFCRECVIDVLHDVCPNCGGGFVPRPIRPATAWIAHQPASTTSRHRPVDLDRHRALAERIGDRGPADR
jgi:hypothetical protein